MPAGAMTVGELAAYLDLDQTRYDKGLDQARAKGEKFEKTTFRSKADIDTTMAQSKLGALGGLISQNSAALTSSGQKLTAGVTLPILALDTISLKLAGDLEQSAVAFKTMLGSAGAADEFIKKLQAFAAATPFGFTDLQVQAKRMLAYGFAAEEVLPMLTDVGDAAAAIGDPQALETITRAFGQMNAKGKISAEEMMQINEAGVRGWQFLADGMGVSVAEVMRQVTAGQVTAEQGIAAIRAGMQKQYGGLMAEQSKTMLGQVNNAMDELKMSLAKFGDAIAPIAKPAIGFFTDLLGVVSKLPGPVLTVLGVLGGAAATLGPALWMLGGIADGLKAVKAGWAAIRTAFTVADSAAIATNTAAVTANTIARELNAGTPPVGSPGAAPPLSPNSALPAAAPLGAVATVGMLGVALPLALVAAGELILKYGPGPSDVRAGKNPGTHTDPAALEQGKLYQRDKKAFDDIAARIKALKPGADTIGAYDDYIEELRTLRDSTRSEGVKKAAQKVIDALKSGASAFDAAGEAAAALAEETRKAFGSMQDFQAAMVKAAVMGEPLPTAAQAAYASQSDQAAALADYLKNKVSTPGVAKNDRTGQVGMKYSSHATGADFFTSGPQMILVGDNASGKEHVKVTPDGKGSDRSIVVNLAFHGPVVGGRSGLRELSRMVQGDVMAGVQRGLVGQNA